MTLVDVLTVLYRRWYVVLLGLVLTAAMAIAAGYTREDGRFVSRFSSQYETSAVVHVRAAPGAGAPVAEEADVAAAELAYTLEATVESGSFLRRVAAEMPGWRGGSVQAAVPDRTSLVELLVSGPTPTAAAASMEAVLAALPPVAAELHDPGRLPALEVRVTGAATPPDERPTAQGPLATGIVALLGLALTWAVAVSLDRARRPVAAEILLPDLREPSEPRPRPERVGANA